MGASENPKISFELDHFNFPSINMDSLVEPFSTSEIDKVIQHSLRTKAQGLMALMQDSSKNVGIL
jgi:hypothetical protein